MMKNKVEVVEEMDEKMGEVDKMVKIVEEDEVLMLWNIRKERMRIGEL
jgi:aspartate carbamoyltransferase catalytic subunit